jgi:LuxR family maltose regulon positive regulatory protein
VRREELLRRLSAAQAPLVVVAAPGGYGKTVTLSQWAADDGVPFAWLQADDADNDPLVFLQYLTAALDGVILVDPQVAEWLQLAAPPVQTRILPALAEAVAGAGSFVLVVDDVHLLVNEACWHVLGMLLGALPSGTHLCLSGRREPDLPLARLRAEGRVLELGPSDLALSLDEAQRLLGLNDVTADPDTVARLRQVTEGWPAGLSLAALAGAHASAQEALADVRGDRRDIARYLASEVLEQQPPAVSEFLLQTSILERMSPGLCRAATGDTDAGELLQAVAGSSLFVSSLDDAGEWFRYHHLFAEFLQAELVRRRDEQQVAALHCRAAAWFEDHDAQEEAVRHWLAGGEPLRAGAIVCRVFVDHERCARHDTLRRWLGSFTDEQILGDHALLLAAALIGAMTGDSPRTRTWLVAALRADVGDATWPGASYSLRAVQAALRANFAPEGVTQMYRDAKLAMELSGEDYSAVRAATTVQLGVALWLSDRREEAVVALREGEAVGRVANVLAQVAALGFEALVLAELGRWSDATDRAAAAALRVDELGIAHALPTMPVLLALASVARRTGSPDFEAHMQVINAVVETGLSPLVSLITDVVVAELMLERGDTAGAEQWTRAGSACLATWPDAGILRERLQRLRERLEERRLTGPLTPAERRVLELLPTELSLREIAERLFVSRETVRTHTRDIYRKLEVHSRTEAVARAREVGLLG